MFGDGVRGRSSPLCFVLCAKMSLRSQHHIPAPPLYRARAQRCAAAPGAELFDAAPLGLGRPALWPPPRSTPSAGPARKRSNLLSATERQPLSPVSSLPLPSIRHPFFLPPPTHTRSPRLRCLSNRRLPRPYESRRSFRPTTASPPPRLLFAMVAHRSAQALLVAALAGTAFAASSSAAAATTTARSTWQEEAKVEDASTECELRADRE